MKILICEDELIIAEFLKETCMELGYTVPAIAGSRLDAMEKLIFHQPNLALIDINMEERESGIELAKYIHETVKIPFIFVTAFNDPETIRKAINTHPHAFLVKPVDKSTLQANIQLAFYRFNTPMKKEEFVSFNTESGTIKVNISELLYIEANGNYCEFIYDNGSRELIRISMQNVEQALGNVFIRTHKSFIVNPAYISGSSSLKVIVKDQQLPIGRKYKPQFQAFFK